MNLKCIGIGLSKNGIIFMMRLPCTLFSSRNRYYELLYFRGLQQLTIETKHESTCYDFTLLIGRD